MNFYGGGARGHFYHHDSIKPPPDPRGKPNIPNGAGLHHDALFGPNPTGSGFAKPSNDIKNPMPNFYQPLPQQAKPNNASNLQRFRSQPDLLTLSNDYNKPPDHTQNPRNLPSSFRDQFRDPFNTNTIQRQPHYPSSQPQTRADPNSFPDRKDYNSLRLPPPNPSMQRWASSDNINRRPTQDFSNHHPAFQTDKFQNMNVSNPYSTLPNYNGLRYPQQYPTPSNGLRTLPHSYKTTSPIRRDGYHPQFDQSYPNPSIKHSHSLAPPHTNHSTSMFDRPLADTRGHSRKLPNPDYVNPGLTRHSHLHIPGISRSEDGATHSRVTPPFGQRNGRTITPMSAPVPSSTWRPTLLPSRFHPKPVGQSNQSKYQSVSSDNSYNPGRASVNKIYFNNAHHPEANPGLPRRSKSYVDLLGSVNGPNGPLSPPKLTNKYSEEPNYPQIRSSTMDPGTKLWDSGNFSQAVPNTPPYDNVVGNHEASDQTLDDEWSLSGFSNVGSDTQMGSASFESENSPSSGNALRQTIFDPGHVDRLVSHLKTLPMVPGPNQNQAFKKNQEMSQALHSIQHIDKFRTESMNKKRPERFSIYSPGADVESSTYDSSFVNNNPLSADGLYSAGSMNDEDQEYSKPTNEYSQNEYTEMIKPQNEVANGVLLRRNKDGSQDIEIFRSTPGASFGFYVYKEPETSQTNKNDKQSKNNTPRNSITIDRKGGLFISRLREGSRLGGLLNVGDKVLKINDLDTKGMTLDQIEQHIINSQESVFLTTLPYLVSIQNLQ